LGSYAQQANFLFAAMKFSDVVTKSECLSGPPLVFARASPASDSIAFVVTGISPPNPFGPIHFGWIKLDF
jgi:hypothetical protein